MDRVRLSSRRLPHHRRNGDNPNTTRRSVPLRPVLVAVAALLLPATTFTIPADGLVPSDSRRSVDKGEPLHLEAGPTRIVIDQSYETIGWRLAGDLTYFDAIDVSLEHASTRKQADFDYAYAPASAGDLNLHAYQTGGRYVLRAQAYDDNYSRMAVPPVFITAKYASRTWVSVSRKGRSIALRALAQRYGGGPRPWIANRLARVTFQKLTPQGWRAVAITGVPADGVARAMIPWRGVKSRYRAVLNESATAWSAISTPVRG
jgi:hypothetical protein